MNFAKTKYPTYPFSICIQIYKSVPTAHSRLAVSVTGCTPSFHRRNSGGTQSCRAVSYTAKKNPPAQTPRHTRWIYGFSQLNALSVGWGWGYLLKLVNAVWKHLAESGWFAFSFPGQNPRLAPTQCLRKPQLLSGN